MKCKQPCPGFEFGSPCSFAVVVTIIIQVPLYIYIYIYIYIKALVVYHDLLIRHRLYVAWTGGPVVEFWLLYTVVVSSISSGGDHGVYSWWDLIRLKQLFSAPYVAYRYVPDFLVMVLLTPMNEIICNLISTLFLFLLYFLNFYFIFYFIFLLFYFLILILYFIFNYLILSSEYELKLHIRYFATGGKHVKSHLTRRRV